jgi:hypothetical protein
LAKITFPHTCDNWHHHFLSPIETDDAPTSFDNWHQAFDLEAKENNPNFDNCHTFSIGSFFF